MQTCIIYYSRSNTNRQLAKTIAKQKSIDIFEITENISHHSLWGYFISGMHNTLKTLTKINDLNINLQKYQRVILISPIWVSILAAPLRTFALKHKNKLKDKEIILLSISGSGDVIFNHKAIDDLENILGRKLNKYYLYSEKDFADHKITYAL